MIDPTSHQQLNAEIAQRIADDKEILDTLRSEVRPLRTAARRIHMRSTTAVSFVAADGGNNSLQYDPFLVQLVRVVDSNNNEYCLEAITPSTNVLELSKKQFDGAGRPCTSLGKLMAYLGVEVLDQLSHMIRRNDKDRPVSPSWVQVYRELVEWAILFTIVRERDFASDTLIVFDGLLRSKVFSQDYYAKFLAGLQEGIDNQLRQRRRRLYLVGFAKHSKVLDRYRLAMALENILTDNYPAYVEIPRDLEQKAYVWSEYARGNDAVMEGGEVNKYVGGKLFFVKFGLRPRDPVWPIDIFLPQIADAAAIMGYLLADANNGFPVPFYPLCLQRAHENAALVDFDFVVLQDQIFESIRTILGSQGPVLDSFRLQQVDPAANRY